MELKKTFEMNKTYPLLSLEQYTYINTKADEYVPDGMARHACKVELAREQFLRKALYIYKSN